MAGLCSPMICQYKGLPGIVWALCSISLHYHSPESHANVVCSQKSFVVFASAHSRRQLHSKITRNYQTLV